MHELGIMTGVLDTAKTAAQEAGALAVMRIDLRVGEMTECIRDALDFAFEALVDLPEYRLFKDCDLVITMVQPKSKCLECGAEYTHDRFHMLCPECGSFATELLEGRELEIDSIEVDLPDEDEVAEAQAAAEACGAKETAEKLAALAELAREIKDDELDPLDWLYRNEQGE